MSDLENLRLMMKCEEFESLTCVGRDQLESMSAKGWKLIAIVMTTVLRKDTNMYGGSPSHYTANNIPYHPIHNDTVTQEPNFVLGLARDKTVVRLQETIQQATEVGEERSKQLAEVRKAKEKLEEQVKGHESDMKSARGHITKLNEEAQRLMDGKRKLEVDLGAVREQIGSKAFDAIVKK